MEEQTSALRDMVRAVSCHPRSFVLLPPLLRERGVRAVTTDLCRLLDEMDATGGGRERSLYASLRLSLDRLPARLRDVVREIGLLRVGAVEPVLQMVLGLGEEDGQALVRKIEARALLRREGSYLHFDSAFPHALEAELREQRTEEERAEAWERVVEAYVGLVTHLYRLKFSAQVRVATTLAQLELPNLLRVLDHLGAQAGEGAERVEQVIGVATRLEGLLQFTPQQRALEGVAALRARLAARLGGDGRWTHRQCEAAKSAIDRLIEAGKLAEAIEAARQLVLRGEAAAEAGQDPYAGADYDRAMAWYSLGWALRRARQSAEGLQAIGQARRIFESLSSAGSANADRMASACLKEDGDCLNDLGRYDEAATCYERAIERARQRGDERTVAVVLSHLAGTRMLQGRGDEALRGFHDARLGFESFGEPQSVATAWHQIGRTLQHIGRHDVAQDAYRRSLALSHSQGTLARMASTFSQLGSVACVAGRFEEAVDWERRALETRCRLEDSMGESMSRNNLALGLYRLGRLNEAEWEALRAAELKEPLGLAALPWTTWDILHDIARARNDVPAAIAARARAIEWYHGYRAQGGAPKFQSAELVAVLAEAVHQTAGAATADQLTALATGPEVPDWIQAPARAIAALLSGDHATAEAALPALHYSDAVELQLLLDSLPTTTS